MLKLSGVRLAEECDVLGLRRVAAELLGVPQSAISDLIIHKLSIDARRKPGVRFVYSLLVSVDDERGVFSKLPAARRSEDAHDFHSSSADGASSRRGRKDADRQAYHVPDVSLFEASERYVSPSIDAASKIINRKPPVVVGTGPAGVFAALCLAEAGVKCIILERGQPVERRIADVERFRRGGGLDPSSNVQFGEGGAGTFSDGKLTTGINDKRIRYVLERLVEFGAPDEILYHAKPHIGTDKLRVIVKAIRARLIELGCEIRFGHTLTDIDLSASALRSVTVRGPDGEYTLETGALILAPGNSARDTFEMLVRRGVLLSPKNFSVGVRIEHSQRCIDFAQYGEEAALRTTLPAADYKLVAHLRSDIITTESAVQHGAAAQPSAIAQHGSDGEAASKTYQVHFDEPTLAKARSVYTFCVCPGGQVVSSSSEPGGVVTNGMSYFARDGENCNGALLVSVTPDDFGYEPLDGVVFQRKLEQAAFAAGGGNYRAPAQFVGDFMKKRASTGRVEKLDLNSGPSTVEQARLHASTHKSVTPTYLPGVCYCNLWDVLPGFVCEALCAALEEFSSRVKGLADPGAVLTAVETRSSSPVRIERMDFETVGIRGIFPCGEGSGHAGGIMSSAVDGIKCAEQIALRSTSAP